MHGLTTDFLADKPLFAAVAGEFLAFIGEDPIVAHNAGFDIGFLNFELARLGFSEIVHGRVVDSLQLARRKHPAGPNSLDALCRRYNVDNSNRIRHGALKDALLLAAVYIELIGERQAALELATSASQTTNGERIAHGRIVQRPRPLPPRVTAAVEAAHRAFVATLGLKAVWWRYLGEPGQR